MEARTGHNANQIIPRRDLIERVLAGVVRERGGWIIRIQDAASVQIEVNRVAGEEVFDDRRVDAILINVIETRCR